MLRLRPYKPADAEFLLKWWEGKEEDDFMKWGAGKFSWPLTAKQLENYYHTWGMEETTGRLFPDRRNFRLFESRRPQLGGL